MQSDRWNRIQALFDSALELGAHERDGYLTRECSDDAELLAEVRTLLAAHERSHEMWDCLAPGATATEAAVPKQVGPYQILGRIGAGGMSVVYRALDTRLQREVALKFLTPQLEAAPEARQRFISEARAASRLDHPHICIIHDIGETEDGHLYLTMPFYPGETVEARVAGGSLPENEAVTITTQIAQGLAAAHAHGIVHRDIKPANIMLTQESGAKILDFGVAKIAGVNMTSTGVSIGTVAYMAPEQLRGEPVDARADVWSLGATLFEMLTGRRAFAGQRLHEVIHAILYSGSSPVDTLPDDMPEILRAVIHRSLQVDPGTRYPSAEAMLADITRTPSHGAPVSHQPVAGVPAAGAVRLSSAELDELITAATPQIGPIAAVLVKRMARVAQSLPELHELLADHIPDARARAAFLEQVQPDASSQSTQTCVTSQSAAPDQGMNASTQLEHIEAALKPMLGPIAGTLIRRQSANCTDLAQLCQILTDYIPGEKDKARFLEMTARLFK